MMHDEEAASPRWKLNPNNFSPNIMYMIFLGLGVKRGFRKQQFFDGLTQTFSAICHPLPISKYIRVSMLYSVVSCHSIRLFTLLLELDNPVPPQPADSNDQIH